MSLGAEARGCQQGVCLMHTPESTPASGQAPAGVGGGGASLQSGHRLNHCHNEDKYILKWKQRGRPIWEIPLSCFSIFSNPGRFQSSAPSHWRLIKEKWEHWFTTQQHTKDSNTPKPTETATSGSTGPLKYGCFFGATGLNATETCCILSFHHQSSYSFSWLRHFYSLLCFKYQIVSLCFYSEQGACDSPSAPAAFQCVFQKQ